jgi:hypothetical protein
MFRVMIAIGILFLVSCSSKKKSLSGEEVETSEDFVQSFNELTLPFMLSDTLIDNKLGDSAFINSKLVNKFIPDSVFSAYKQAKPKYYALGRAVDKSGDNYLFVKASTTAKQTGYIICFDKENNYKAAMPFVNNSADKSVHNEGGMDRRFTIVRNRTKKGSDGQTYYNKNVYVYNNVGTFTLILQESNEELEVAEVYNPIDSMKGAGKWSGDYVKDKKNFVSVRDGAKDNRILFFIHFEEKGGDCRGELKGEAELIRPGVARYTAAGDPCSLELTFTSSKITIQELQGCGNYRGIRCFFNSSYPKKAVPKKKKSATKK